MGFIIRWLLAKVWQLADYGSTLEYIVDLIGIKTAMWAAVGAVVTMATLAWQGAPPWAITLSAIVASLVILTGSAVWQLRHLRAPHGTTRRSRTRSTGIDEDTACRFLQERLEWLRSDDANIIESIANQCSYYAKVRMTSMYRSLRVEPAAQEIDGQFANLVTRAEQVLEPLRIDLPEPLLPLCDEMIEFYRRKRSGLKYVAVLTHTLRDNLTTDQAFTLLREVNEPWDKERQQIVRKITDAARRALRS